MTYAPTETSKNLFVEALGPLHTSTYSCDGTILSHDSTPLMELAPLSIFASSSRIALLGRRHVEIAAEPQRRLGLEPPPAIEYTATSPLGPDAASQLPHEDILRRNTYLTTRRGKRRRGL